MGQPQLLWCQGLTTKPFPLSCLQTLGKFSPHLSCRLLSGTEKILFWEHSKEKMLKYLQHLSTFIIFEMKWIRHRSEKTLICWKVHHRYQTNLHLLSLSSLRSLRLNCEERCHELQNEFQIKVSRCPALFCDVWAPGSSAGTQSRWQNPEPPGQTQGGEAAARSCFWGGSGAQALHGKGKGSGMWKATPESTKATAVTTGWRTDARISGDTRNAAGSTRCTKPGFPGYILRENKLLSMRSVHIIHGVSICSSGFPTLHILRNQTAIITHKSRGN